MHTVKFTRFSAAHAIQGCLQSMKNGPVIRSIVCDYLLSAQVSASFPVSLSMKESSQVYHVFIVASPAIVTAALVATSPDLKWM